MSKKPAIGTGEEERERAALIVEAEAVHAEDVDHHPPLAQQLRDIARRIREDT